MSWSINTSFPILKSTISSDFLPISPESTEPGGRLGSHASALNLSANTLEHSIKKYGELNNTGRLDSRNTGRGSSSSSTSGSSSSISSTSGSSSSSTSGSSSSSTSGSRSSSSSTSDSHGDLPQVEHRHGFSLQLGREDIFHEEAMAETGAETLVETGTQQVDINIGGQGEGPDPASHNTPAEGHVGRSAGEGQSKGGGEQAIHATEGGHTNPPTVSLASWKWHHVSGYLVVTLFIILSGLCKLIFHKLHWLSSRVPESCLLIIIGIGFGAILQAIENCEDKTVCSPDLEPSHKVPEFTPDLFFYLLLPPIILEAAYSLHNRVFVANLRTILLYAVFGTIFNFLLIGAFLIVLYRIEWMGDDQVYERKFGTTDMENTNSTEVTIGGLTAYSSMTQIQILLFASLISAVDPVAVLAIFSEVGVNPDLYFLVFGESLLNDGVAVVIYNMMTSFAGMEAANIEITHTNIVTGVFSFFTIALGGLLVGFIFGIVTALVTRCTREVEVLEPLSVFCCAYLSYVAADLFGWSGIISLIGCGLVQAHYSFKNISQNSLTTIKYFVKMLSSTCDCLIFLYLGMAVLGEQVWHTGFICWSLFLVFVIRFIGTFLQTWFVNRLRDNICSINYQEQFVMAYGGLRGAVGFSLVKLIRQDIVPSAGLFVTTTLAVIMATVFVQGSTIKSLVTLLNISKAKDEQEGLAEEINSKVFDHIMSGVEVISGKYGHHYVNAFLDQIDKKYLKKWFCVPDYDRKMKKIFQQIVLDDHLTSLYGPARLDTTDSYKNSAFEPDENSSEPDTYTPSIHSTWQREKYTHFFDSTKTVSLTAKDLAEFSNALKVDPVKIYHQQAHDRNILHGRQLNFLEETISKKREHAARMREMVLIKHARRRGRRASSVGDSPFDHPFSSQFSVISENSENFPNDLRRGSVEYRSLTCRRTSIKTPKFWQTPSPKERRTISLLNPVNEIIRAEYTGENGESDHGEGVGKVGGRPPYARIRREELEPSGQVKIEPLQAETRRAFHVSKVPEEDTMSDAATTVVEECTDPNTEELEETHL